MSELSPGVLVDRDGTLIREVGYLWRPAQMEILPRVPEAIQWLRRHGLRVAVVTNQSGVARGYLSEAELAEIHQELKRRLAARGAFLDGIYYCPHHPTRGVNSYGIPCDCRKPNGGLARRAAEELNLDAARCYVVGDQAIDMEMASRVGAKGILIQDRRREREDDRRPGTGDGLPSSVSGRFSVTVPGPQSPVFVVRDLWEAAQWIVRDLQGT